MDNCCKKQPVYAYVCKVDGFGGGKETEDSETICQFFSPSSYNLKICSGYLPTYCYNPEAHVAAKGGKS